MRKGGQVTVFLSMILLCICSLMAALVLSARMAGARCYLQIAANSALDSVMSQYHRQLWQTYHLLGLEYGGEGQVQSELEHYVKAYLEHQGFFSLELQEVELKQTVFLTDLQSGLLEAQILDYMKYGIWNMEQDPKVLQQTLIELKQADSLKAVAGEYEACALDTFELERTLERLQQRLEQIEKSYEQAKQELLSHRATSFYRQANKLVSQLESLPQLLKQYESQADGLANRLSEARTYYEARKQDLGQEVIQSLEDQVNQYAAYIEEGGSKREAIMGLEQLALQNIQLTEEVAEQAREVEQIIEDWEGEEESEEDLDLDQLWQPVIEQFHHFQKLSLPFSQSVGDEEKRNLLEQVARLASGQILELVIPEQTRVSNTTIRLENAPSQTATGLGQGKSGDCFDHPVETLVTGALVNEYSIYHFDHFLKEPGSAVQYQLEYIISGKPTDKENLEATIQRTLLIRQGMNLIHILTDSQKQQQARALALSLVGSVGMVPLAGIMAFFIMNVWAFAEAVLDVKALLHADSVPLIKQNNQWQLTLEQLLDIGKTRRFDSREKTLKQGLDYEGYLRLLLLLKTNETKYVRLMDLIQDVIGRSQPDFLMETCVGSLDMVTRAFGTAKISVSSGKHY